MFACEQEGVTPGLPVPRQGRHRRLPAARGDAHDRARLRGLPRRARAVPHLLPRPHLHGQPARLRGRARDARRVRGGAHARAPAAEDRAARRAARRARRAAARTSREIRRRGFMTGIELTELPGRRRAWATGHARGARARRDHPPARRHDRADAAAGDRGRAAEQLVRVTAAAISVGDEQRARRGGCRSGCSVPRGELSERSRMPDADTARRDGADCRSRASGGARRREIRSGAVLVGGEVLLAGAADRAEPRVRDVLERGARRGCRRRGRLRRGRR